MSAKISYSTARPGNARISLTLLTLLALAVTGCTAPAAPIPSVTANPAPVWKPIDGTSSEIPVAWSDPQGDEIILTLTGGGCGLVPESLIVESSSRIAIDTAPTPEDCSADVRMTSYIATTPRGLDTSSSIAVHLDGEKIGTLPPLS
ncbi:hypothetical protein HNR05_001325 [Leifsonia psychrotolerans]|uniref:META domain-containing protein n=1 Tax=Glaciibacter psychrotolerans TaxID=670054 RepID=A0A7Z0J637_9MICO|nr:hypothetical protein [Leifsonia psychrotolerans]